MTEWKTEKVELDSGTYSADYSSRTRSPWPSGTPHYLWLLDDGLEKE